MIVSIHAPARGATVVRRLRAHCVLVSIHAPARGATHHACDKVDCFLGFNPRARAGRDIKARQAL